MPIAYEYAATPATAPAKTSADFLDYTLSWSQEFGPGGGSPGDTIAKVNSLTVAPSGSMVVSAQTIILSNEAVLFWAASGIAGQTYEAILNITTTNNRIYERSLMIPVGDSL